MPDNFLATNSTGDMKYIPDCWIRIPGLNLGEDGDMVRLNALPEINEAKSVRYSDQTIQGRAAPIKTYAYSENRTISMTLHLYVTLKSDIKRNIEIIRGIASLTHPEYNASYLPPRIARIKCGKLLSGDPQGVPVSLKSYEINYDNTVQWFWSEEDQTYFPLHLSLPTSWDVVYSSASLPGADQVLGLDAKY
jgi:hypothetical protein